jgi:NAD(P) transhydrogenase subunit alpha
MGSELFLLAEASFPLATEAAKAAEAGREAVAVNPLILYLTIFVLAIFVGFEIITKIPPTLHTPLMSGSNAISGITVVGAIIAAGHGAGVLATILGTLAVALATINVVGGFLVTHRMLGMFRRK